MPTTPPPLPIWHSHIGYTKSIVIIKFLKILKICSKQQKSWWFYMYLHSKDERSKNVNENNTYTWNQFKLWREFNNKVCYHASCSYNFIGWIVFQISIYRWQLKPWFSIHKFCFALWSETNLENSTAYVKNICYIIILLKYLWLQYYKIFICIFIKLSM